MAQRTYRYWLPNNNGIREDHETLSNSIVIIGANGSGKSKLGAWIEQQDLEMVHRIASQRSLNFSENVPLRSYSEAEGVVFYGVSDPIRGRDKSRRWDWNKSNTTKLLDDFDLVLAALIAKHSNATQKYYESCREAESLGKAKPSPPDTALYKLNEIWNSVFPQRELRFDDASFNAAIPNSSVEYSATQMSDGERAVLYLASQVLCVPKDKTLIVDEPELHLHASLISKLWIALEQARPDCLFVYITHDPRFAMEHSHSDIVWVKSYDGKLWEWSFIPDSELPEELMISLTGNRKPVLFVEGEASSYDMRLYTLLYPAYHVVPCGSCEEVIRNTKAYSATEGLNGILTYGIIDRDYRPQEQLDAYQRSGIHTLGVAEIESLFLTRPVIMAMAKQFLVEDPEDAFEQIRRYVIEGRFRPQLEKQIRSATISSLKAALTGLDITPSANDPVDTGFQNAIRGISPTQYYEEQKCRFEEAANSEDYDKVLEIFNDKSIARSIGHFLGIDDRQYCDRVCQLLSDESGENLRSVLMAYVPQLQPPQ